MKTQSRGSCRGRVELIRRRGATFDLEHEHRSQILTDFIGNPIRTHAAAPSVLTAEFLGVAEVWIAAHTDYRYINCRLVAARKALERLMNGGSDDQDPILV